MTPWLALEGHGGERGAGVMVQRPGYQASLYCLCSVTSLPVLPRYHLSLPEAPFASWLWAAGQHCTSLAWGEGLALSLALSQLTKPPPSLRTPLSAAQPLCTMYCKDTAFLARSPWSKQSIIGSSCSEDRYRQHFMTLQSYHTYIEFA